MEGRFQVFQKFTSSKLVLKTVGSCFVALNYYEDGSCLTMGLVCKTSPNRKSNRNRNRAGVFPETVLSSPESCFSLLRLLLRLLLHPDLDTTPCGDISRYYSWEIFWLTGNALAIRKHFDLQELFLTIEKYSDSQEWFWLLGNILTYRNCFEY